MAIAQRGATYAGTYSGAGAFVVPFPTGTAVGDYLVLLANTGNGAATLTGPVAAGWTEHVNADTSTTKIAIWSKVATSGDVSTGSVSVTRSVSALISITLTAWSGTTGFDAFSSPAAYAATTAGTVPAVTPAAADCLQLALGTARPTATNTAVTHTPASGYTGLGESIDAGTGNRRMTFQDAQQLTGQAGVAQATGSITFSTASNGIIYSLTMAPQAGGTGAVTGSTSSDGVVDGVVSGAYRGFNDFDTSGRVPFDVQVNPSAETSAAGYIGNGLEVAVANAVTRNRWSTTTFGATKRYGAITFRLRFRALPLTANLGGTSAAIMTSKNTTPNSGTGQGHFGMFFQPSDNKLHWDMLAANNGASTMTFVAGQFYLVQAKWDYGSSTYTADIQIDGISQGSIASSGLTPYYVQAMGFGSDQTNQTYSYDIDNVLFAASSSPLDFLTLTGDVAGSTASTGTVTGVVGRAGAVSGSTASTGTVTGTVTAGVTGTVSGSTASTGTVTGQVAASGAVTGSTSSTGVVAGQVGRAGAVTGSTASTGTVTGTVTAGATGTVAGSTASTGAVAGQVGLQTSVSGSTASTGVVAGTVGGGAPVGAVSGSTASTGVVAGRVGLFGAVTGSTASTGVVGTAQAGPSRGTLVAARVRRGGPRGQAPAAATAGPRPASTDSGGPRPMIST